MLSYEYDEEKNKTNKQKHGISFDEAITVFQDPLLKITSDNYPTEKMKSLEDRKSVV